MRERRGVPGCPVHPRNQRERAAATTRRRRVARDAAESRETQRVADDAAVIPPGRTCSTRRRSVKLVEFCERTRLVAGWTERDKPVGLRSGMGRNRG